MTNPPTAAVAPRRLLVTGGRGYLGRAIIEHALAIGHTVVSYDREWSNDLPRAVGSAFGDLHDITRLTTVLADNGIEAIIHTAAFSNPELSVAVPMTVVHANIVGTTAVLDAARLTNTPIVVNLSTHRCYGDHQGLTAEDTALNPASPYAVTKVAAELLAQSYHSHYGLTTVSLRVAEIYGPGLTIPTPVSQLVEAAAHHHPLLMAEGAEQSMELVHVRDAARAAVLAACADSLPRPAYNITGPHQVNLADCAHAVRTLRPDLHVEVGPGLLDGYDQRGPLDQTASHRDLGYRARIDLVDGLADWISTLEQRQ